MLLMKMASQRGKDEFKDYTKYIGKTNVPDSANPRKNTAKDKKDELVHFFLVKAGDDFCSNISTMYTLMIATGEPASQMVRRLNMNGDIEKSWIKDLLGIQKYGYSYNSCISMYYGDIPANETITGYNYYQNLREILSSAPASDLLTAKKNVLNQEAGKK